MSESEVSGRVHSADLVAQADLAMLQRNGFRVLGLPVTATANQIQKQKSSFAKRMRLGMPVDTGVAGALKLPVSPDEDALNRAIERLSEPETRLLDEMTWFWGATAEAESKDLQEARELVAAGELESAITKLSKLASGPRGPVAATAAHEVAVAAHLLALESTSTDESVRVGLWRRALQAWGQAASGNGAWLSTRLRARLASLDDPRYSTSLAERVCDEVPTVIAHSAAVAARTWLSEGRTRVALECLAALEKCSLPRDAKQRARRAVAKPLIANVEHLVTRARNLGKGKPLACAKVGAELATSAGSPLEIIKCVAGADDPAVAALHDSVANAVVDLQIEYANATCDWGLSRQILDQAKDLVMGEQVRARVVRNIEIVASNYADFGHWEVAEEGALEEALAGRVAAALLKVVTGDRDAGVRELRALVDAAKGNSPSHKWRQTLLRAWGYGLLRRAHRTIGDLNETLARPTAVMEKARARIHAVRQIDDDTKRQRAYRNRCLDSCAACGTNLAQAPRYGESKVDDIAVKFCGPCIDRHNAGVESDRSKGKGIARRVLEDSAIGLELIPNAAWAGRTIEDVRSMTSQTVADIRNAARRTLQKVTGRKAAKQARKPAALPVAGGARRGVDPAAAGVSRSRGRWIFAAIAAAVFVGVMLWSNSSSARERRIDAAMDVGVSAKAPIAEAGAAPLGFAVVAAAVDERRVPDAAVREAIAATDLPWRVRHASTGITFVLVPPGRVDIQALYGTAAPQPNTPRVIPVVREPYYVCEAPITPGVVDRVLRGRRNTNRRVAVEDSFAARIGSGARLPVDGEWAEGWDQGGFRVVRPVDLSDAARLSLAGRWLGLMRASLAEAAVGEGRLDAYFTWVKKFDAMLAAGAVGGGRAPAVKDLLSEATAAGDLGFKHGAALARWFGSVQRETDARAVADVLLAFFPREAHLTHLDDAIANWTKAAAAREAKSTAENRRLASDAETAMARVTKLRQLLSGEGGGRFLEAVTRAQASGARWKVADASQEERALARSELIEAASQAEEAFPAAARDVVVTRARAGNSASATALVKVLEREFRRAQWLASLNAVLATEARAAQLAARHLQLLRTSSAQAATEQLIRLASLRKVVRSGFEEFRKFAAEVDTANGRRLARNVAHDEHQAACEAIASAFARAEAAFLTEALVLAHAQVRKAELSSAQGMLGMLQRLFPKHDSVLALGRAIDLAKVEASARAAEERKANQAKAAAAAAAAARGNLPEAFEVVAAEPDRRIVRSATDRRRITSLGRPWRVRHVPSGIELVLIPNGVFQMGSPTKEVGRNANIDETQHRRTIAKAFYLGVTEVTQAQWKRVLDTVPGDGADPLQPVRQVSWIDCQEFAQRAGGGLRLPSESEWEYACRAGTTTTYSTGSTLTPAWANYRDSTPAARRPTGVIVGQVARVHAYRANALGLFDMHGNVWEWCADALAPYPKAGGQDPVGDGARRVLRGGSYASSAADCRSAARRWGLSDFRLEDVGLRVAVSLP